MKFVDELIISVSGGRGGNGCMSFRREKFIPKGGPDGGNGGRGGDFILVATRGLQTLADLERKRHYVAKNGEHGRGNAKNGRAGESVQLPVPCGTLVYDTTTGEGLADLVEPGDAFVAAMGGRGGRGNRVFASSLRRAPRFSEKGELGEERRIRLELKLIADIGLVGLPNAGKSSILAALSNAAPKIADYPFTTLSPNLGVLHTDFDAVVLADIPGLIEGASDNKGLGLAFLRHIERTRLMLHVLDISSMDTEAIKRDWEVVRNELKRYDPKLTEHPCIVVGNKIDLFAETDGTSGQDALFQALSSFFTENGFTFCAVSALTGQSIPELARRVVDFAREHPRPRGDVRLFGSIFTEEKPLQQVKKQKIQIVSLPDGSFRVLQPRIEKTIERYDFSQPENLARFVRFLRKHRVEELLLKAGAVRGDSVSIGRVDFDFIPDEDISSVLPADESDERA